MGEIRVQRGKATFARSHCSIWQKQDVGRPTCRSSSQGSLVASDLSGRLLRTTQPIELVGGDTEVQTGQGPSTRGSASLEYL